MPRLIEIKCDTCRCPTMTTINSSICLGWRSRDGVIYKLQACVTWKAAPTHWTITEALTFAKYKGVVLSRPTVIKLCRETVIGRQIFGRGGKWLVDAYKFKQIMNELKYKCT